MNAAIICERLTKHFRSRVAVDNLSLEVPQGAIFALLGENGAGKSTTIKMLAGLLRPDSGRATILDQDCWHPAERLRQQVGYMPERPKFYDWMTIDEIGRFSAGFHKLGFQARFRRCIEQFDLEPRQKLNQLSKGQYAKVALALALACDPAVLILDEPTSGLDLLVRREFLASMVDLVGDGRTVLIASHQIAEVERVASHVAFMSHGRLLHASSLDDLRDRVLGLRVQYEGAPPEIAHLGTLLRRQVNGHELHAVLREPNRHALAQLNEQPTVRNIETRVLSLEDVYCAFLEKSE